MRTGGIRALAFDWVAPNQFRNRRGMLLVFLAFLLSTLLFVVANLLYGWAAPDWFARFPYSACYRMLDALNVYFLCTSLFLGLVLSLGIADHGLRFWPGFSLSYLPALIFATLAAMSAPLQLLHGLALITDILVWLALTAALLILTKGTARRPFTGAVRSGLLLTSLFVAAAILSWVSIVPLALLAGGRLAAVAVLSLVTGASLLSSHPETLQGVARRFRLSPRETDVLALLAEGRTNEEIGVHLYVSLSTVKSHVASIFEKTGVRNRAEAAALCRKT